MANADIKKQASGEIEVSGALTFDEVVKLLDRSRVMFEGDANLLFNLQGVVKTDSAGLALLVEWTRMASKKNQQINFCDVPKQLLDIARVSGLDALLPIV